MKDSPKEAFIAGTNAVNETLKYSCATAEYSGLVSLSYIRRGGCYIYDPIAKAVEPVYDMAANACKKTADGIGWTCDQAASGLSRLVKAIPYPGKRLRQIEERLQEIEEWMANIEKHGLVMTSRELGGMKKKLTEEKEALLKNILIENLELKSE
jgi:hypothetical protein